MSKSTLEQLNDMLLETLQNIVDPDVDADNNVINEVSAQKALSVARVAQVIVNNAKVQVDAYRLLSNGYLKSEELPKNLISKNATVENEDK